MGISVAVDDFGTGYSSLSYLRDLPVDELKIDRLFVSGLRATDAAIVRSTIELAHNLGLKIVAEGVESMAFAIASGRSAAIPRRGPSSRRRSAPRRPGAGSCATYQRAHVILGAAQEDAPFRLLFAANPLPMWLYDSESLRFLEVNDAAVSHYGYTRDEFLQKRITDLRTPEDAERLVHDLRRAGPGLRRWTNMRHRTRDARILDVEIAAHTLEFHGHAAVLVVVHDVTEREARGSGAAPKRCSTPGNRGNGARLRHYHGR